MSANGIGGSGVSATASVAAGSANDIGGTSVSASIGGSGVSMSKPTGGALRAAGIGGSGAGLALRRMQPASRR